jgi:hypothetical protein
VTIRPIRLSCYWQNLIPNLHTKMRLIIMGKILWFKSTKNTRKAAFLQSCMCLYVMLHQIDPFSWTCSTRFPRSSFVCRGPANPRGLWSNAPGHSWRVAWTTRCRFYENSFRSKTFRINFHPQISEKFQLKNIAYQFSRVSCTISFELKVF